MSRFVFSALAVCLLGGCFTTELDPSLSGVFNCEDDEECADGQSCLGNVCVADDDVPFVEITDPALGTPIPVSATDPIVVTFTVRTNVELMPADPDAPPGLEGFLEGILIPGSGAPVTQLVEEGQEEVTFTYMLDPTTEPTPLKFQVAANTANGTRFPVDTAVARTVAFIDDQQTPQIAVVEPWPNTTFAAGQVNNVPLSLATINFTMRPLQTMPQVTPGFGHAHLYQANPTIEMFPVGCLMARLDCDTENNFYTTVAPMEETNFFETTVVLNPAAPGLPVQGSIAVVLVNDNHMSVNGGTPESPRVIVDAVRLDRQ